MEVIKDQLIYGNLNMQNTSTDAAKKVVIFLVRFIYLFIFYNAFGLFMEI